MDALEMDALKDKLERLVIEQYSKYKEENKRLKEEIKHLHSVIEQYSKYKEENEKLRERDDTRSYLHGLRKENEGLKKVIEVIDGVIKSGVD